MPRQLAQYRVFIGSPGGLQEEREAFRRVLTTFNEHHGEPNGVLFAPVGWEDALGGVGRPQELINEDVRNCDFAVFVFHDRWGSPTGNGKTSGTQEEWELALELYEKKSIRKICLFFKNVDSSKLVDPGPQLQKVLDFKASIEQEKKHLFRTYGDISGYCTPLEKHVANWMRDIIGSFGKEAPTLSQAPAEFNPSSSEVGPSFSFWLGESKRLSQTDRAGAKFCAEMALKSVSTDLEWADAENARAIALDDLVAAFDSFSTVADRFLHSKDSELRTKCARALYNKGVTLGQLGRNEEAIVVYDDVVARFGMASGDVERRQTSGALVNKGVILGKLGRHEEAIAVYDDVVARFGSEEGLREQVARALVNKGIRLGEFGRSEDAIAAYDGVIEKFGTASEIALRNMVARALVNKGLKLGELGRSEDAIAAYDGVIEKFGTASEAALRKHVDCAKSQRSKIVVKTKSKPKKSTSTKKI